MWLCTVGAIPPSVFFSDRDVGTGPYGDPVIQCHELPFGGETGVRRFAVRIARWILEHPIE